jgi:lipoprotein-releasing system ATP-binding protein
MADIELRDLGKVYGTTVKTTALRGIDLAIQAGEYMAIIGRSGSGKSTLLNIIGTLDRPTTGRMLIDGRDLFTADDDALADFRSRTLGFIFQFHYLLPEFNALENVLLPYRIRHGRADAAAVKRAQELVEIVGIGPRMLNRANDLSGGEQQRIAIARSLINSPRIILADEPTGNLDSETSESVKDLLRRINREFKTTFIIVTHDRHIAAGCDRVVEIEDGAVKRDFRTADLSEDENWARLAPCNCREKAPGRLPEVPAA